MKSVNIGSNPYCGPAVLSILTGRTTDEVASVLMQVTGRHHIAEVYPDELKRALTKMRYQYTDIDSSCSMFSLFHQIYDKDGFYVVVVPKHVVAVEVSNKQVYLCDNHTKEPINGATSARLGNRVITCFKVAPKPEPIFLRSELEFTLNPNNYGMMSLHVANWDIYENEEDNIRREIGTLRIKNETELKLIRDEMLKRF